ncbi:MAG TPA: PTS sugar transporter subunit IIA [Thermoanaerobaculia bacterium]|nr:PTS sugar transporter subunit IIA [Thermoanaerobaculia bacterium]
MRLGSLTRPDLIFLGLAATDRKGLLHELSENVARQGLVANAEELASKLWEREQLGSTGVGAEVAIPHCKIKGLAHGVLAVGVVPEGIDFAAVDGRPVKVFFLVISPSESPAEHLQVLAAISRWVKADANIQKMLALPDRDSIYDLLRQEGS